MQVSTVRVWDIPAASSLQVVLAPPHHMEKKRKHYAWNAKEDGTEISFRSDLLMYSLHRLIKRRQLHMCRNTQQL